jgi:predicted DNA-binding transcriptional regulator YafY
MAEIPKSERIFRLIRLLREKKRTAKQLSEILSSNIRSIYRDLEDISDALPVSYPPKSGIERKRCPSTEPFPLPTPILARIRILANILTNSRPKHATTSASADSCWFGRGEFLVVEPVRFRDWWGKQIKDLKFFCGQQLLLQPSLFTS